MRVAIMHDRRREDRLEPLLDRLGYPDAFIADGTNGGSWLALSRALYTVPSTDQHTLIIEDDAIPARNLIPAVQRAIEAQPESVLYFFTTPRSNGLAMLEAALAGTSWVELKGTRVNGTVCVVIPHKVGKGLVEWGYKPDTCLMTMRVLSPDRPWSGDCRLHLYCNRFGVRRLLYHESLCDHDEEDTSQSLMSTPVWYKRRGYRFVEDASGCEFDKGVLELSDTWWSEQL